MLRSDLFTIICLCMGMKTMRLFLVLCNLWPDEQLRLITTILGVKWLV